MHTHTIYSKHSIFLTNALNTPQEMVRAGVKAGLDGIAITDHNTVRGSLVAKAYAKSLGRSFTVITGSEIKSASGDIIGLGIKENVKPMLSVEETVERIHDLGGIAVAAHPFQLSFSAKAVSNEASKADAVEVFNSNNALEWMNVKAEVFAKKHHMPVCAGSDSHCALSVGNAGIICEGDPLSAIMRKKAKVFGKISQVWITPYIACANTLRLLRL